MYVHYVGAKFGKGPSEARFYGRRKAELPCGNLYFRQQTLNGVVVCVEPANFVAICCKKTNFGLDDSVFAAPLLISVVDHKYFHVFLECQVSITPENTPVTTRNSNLSDVNQIPFAA